MDITPPTPGGGSSGDNTMGPCFPQVTGQVPCQGPRQSQEKALHTALSRGFRPALPGTSSQRMQPQARRSYLSIPDMHALVEGAAGQILPIKAECYTVDRLLMLGQCVDADISLHIPQPNRRIKRSAGKEAEKAHREWEHQGSNSQPCACLAGTHATELYPRSLLFKFSLPLHFTIN